MTPPSALTLGQVFTRTMGVYRPAFGALFVSIMLPIAAFQAIFAAMMALVQTNLGDDQLTGLALAGVAAIFVVALVSIAIALVSGGALSHAAYRLAGGHGFDAMESWRQGARPRVFATLILSGLGVFAGILCCIVPGAYLALIWAFVLPVVFEESLAYSHALRRSNEISRFNPSGQFGDAPRVRVFLIYLVTVVTTYILAGIVQLPSMIAAILWAIRAGQGDGPHEMPALIHWLGVPTAFVTSIVQSALVVFSAVAIATLYFDIRGRMEAKDLDAAISDMGAGRTRG